MGFKGAWQCQKQRSQYLEVIMQQILQTITSEATMKNTIMLGAVLGVLAATAIYSATNEKPVKRAKKMLLDRLEDILD